MNELVFILAAMFAICVGLPVLLLTLSLAGLVGMAVVLRLSEPFWRWLDGDGKEVGREGD